MTHSSLALQASCNEQGEEICNTQTSLLSIRVEASFKLFRRDDDDESIEIGISISFGHIMCWLLHCAGVDKAHALNEHSGREDSIGYVKNFV